VSGRVIAFGALVNTTEYRLSAPNLNLVFRQSTSDKSVEISCIRFENASGGVYSRNRRDNFCNLNVNPRKFRGVLDRGAELRLIRAKRIAFDEVLVEDERIGDSELCRNAAD
jgi:hypothetical protein